MWRHLRVAGCCCYAAAAAYSHRSFFEVAAASIRPQPIGDDGSHRPPAAVEIDPLRVLADFLGTYTSLSWLVLLPIRGNNQPITADTGNFLAPPPRKLSRWSSRPVGVARLSGVGGGLENSTATRDRGHQNAAFSTIPVNYYLTMDTLAMVQVSKYGDDIHAINAARSPALPAPPSPPADPARPLGLTAVRQGKALFDLPVVPGVRPLPSSCLFQPARRWSIVRPVHPGMIPPRPPGADTFHGRRAGARFSSCWRKRARPSSPSPVTAVNNPGARCRILLRLARTRSSASPGVCPREVSMAAGSTLG